MRVVLVSSEPVDYTIAFANGLAPHADITTILPRDRYDPLREWIDAAAGPELVDWPRTRSLRNPAFLGRLIRRIRGLDPDIIHLLSNSTVWLNALGPSRGRALLVTTVHDVAVHPGDHETGRLPPWGARFMARQSDHLVVHGEGLRAAAVAAFGKRPDHIHVLPHPALRRYAGLARTLGLVRSRPPDEFVVLLFGRIFAYKGLQTLVRAEAALRDRLPGLRIVIAGRGDDPSDLRHLMGDAGRYDIRRGFIPDREVAQLFEDADLVVLPYDEASQSGVLHLAATFGKPMIVTDVGELRATVEAAGNGLVVPPRDPAALSEAILRLAARPAERASLGRSAQRWSEGPNAETTIGAAAARLYRDLLRRADDASAEGMQSTT